MSASLIPASCPGSERPFDVHAREYFYFCLFLFKVKTSHAETEDAHENMLHQETCPREVVPYIAIQNATRLSVDPIRPTINLDTCFNSKIPQAKPLVSWQVPKSNEMKPYTFIRCSNNITKLFLYLSKPRIFAPFPMLIHHNSHDGPPTFLCYLLR
jgi:hypothetical protein